jgi:hypothetical protein
VTLLIGLLILFVLAIPLAISIRRSNELFRARVRGGELELLRGRIPQAMFDDLNDVLAGTSADGELTVVVEQGRPSTRVRGLGEATAQRVRNVVGRFRVAQIRAGRGPKNRAQRRKRR